MPCLYRKPSTAPASVACKVEVLIRGVENRAPWPDQEHAHKIGLSLLTILFNIAESSIAKLEVKMPP